MTAPIAAALILLAALVGAPLFAVFGLASLLLFGSLEGTPITGATNDVFSERFAHSTTLVTIPLFTFAGALLAEGRAPQRLVRLSRAWLGFLPGGLAVVCLLASAFFTTFTGGSGITILAVGGLLFPMLKQGGYPERFSLGLVTTGGSLGLLFPPSVPLVLYGIIAMNASMGLGVELRLETLFRAGFLPGLLSVLALVVYASIVGARARVARTPFVLTESLRATWAAKWELALPVTLLGGLATGTLRIHEASAFAAAYVLGVELLIHRDVRPRDLPRIAREATTITGAILVILATAIGFTAYLVQADVPGALLAAVDAWISSPEMFLLVLNLFLLVVGMLMDVFSAIIVVAPLVIPVAARFGINPYHLGVMFLLNLELGYLTPPVGLNLFLSSFRFRKPLGEVTRASLPGMLLLLAVLAIVTYVPWLSTWLTGTPTRVEPVSPAEALEPLPPIDLELDLGDP